MYFVYIIRSDKDGKLYTGITNDINRRLKQHNGGCNQSTKSRTPFKLVYIEKVSDRILARQREIYFKSGTGREYIKNLLQINNMPR